jgi:hypothetical protein
MKFVNMKGALLKTLFCFSLVLLITEENFAQGGIFSKKNKINQYSYLSIGGGSSHYFGDLAPYRTLYYSLYTNVRWNATINYTRQLSPQVAARVGFTWARIVGDDFTYSQRKITEYFGAYLRNLHFRNDIKEFTLSGVFNLLPQSGKGQQGRRNFMPYAVLGIGFYGHNPVAKAPIDPSGVSVSKDWISLKDQKTSGQDLDPTFPKSYSLVQMVFPVALGVKMKINEKIDINFEGGLRITPFDYLDDVSGTKYANPALFTDPLARALANRAGEDYSARTGKDRTPVFVDIMTDPAYGFNVSGVVTPSSIGQQFVGYNAGLSNPALRRGSPRWDSYFVTQITISYIIGSTIKCPPIK